MRRHPSTVSAGGPIIAAALFLALGLSGPAGARAAVDRFEVLVPLSGTTEADRAAGFGDALRAVAVKASGRREAAANASVASADPQRYVRRYSTTPERMLKVGFDPAAVEQLLQQAGLPLWAAERPLTLVSAPVTDPAEIERAAQARGLPIGWSGAATTATDADAGRAVLTGVPSGDQVAWTFSHAGQTTRTRGSLADGIHLAADTLAARYAPASTRSTSSLELRIGGMQDLGAYAGLMAYLGSLSVVRDVVVEALEDDVVRLRLTVRGDRELLVRIAALEGRLQPATQPEHPAEPAVDFVFQP